MKDCKLIEDASYYELLNISAKGVSSAGYYLNKKDVEKALSEANSKGLSCKIKYYKGRIINYNSSEGSHYNIVGSDIMEFFDPLKNIKQIALSKLSKEERIALGY